MTRGIPVPAVHQAIVAAAVRAVLGERAVVRQIVEVPAGASAGRQIVALGYGIQTLWRRWTHAPIERELDNR
jgi:hypothetical protein